MRDSVMGGNRMKQLENKVILLTGATGGIGIPIARMLIGEGARLLLTGLEEDVLADIAEELGENCAYFAADLLQEGAPADIIAYCARRFGRLDILINNAGIASRKPILDVTKAELMKHFEINAYAPLAMAQAAVPMLKDSGAGDIITICSSSGMYPYVGQACYSASKHAQRALMEILTMELYETGIRVHTIAPTGVDTGMIRITRPDLNGDAYCKPEEIAEIIVFLLAHRNNSVIDEVYVRRHAKMPFEP